MAEGMYREYEPCDALRPYVACWWTARWGERSVRVLPDGCMDLLVDLERAEIAVVGTMTTAIVAASPGAALLGVRFRPGEAGAVLGLPAPELTDRSVSLDALWGAAAAELAERMASVATPAEQIRIGEGVLLARLGARRADWRVRRAVALLEQPRSPSVEAVARALGLGARQLERLFTERVGIGPKRFARVMRLQRALAPLSDPGVDLATVAVLGGFSDPSHVVREVRALCGVTPSVLAGERTP